MEPSTGHRPLRHTAGCSGKVARLVEKFNALQSSIHQQIVVDDSMHEEIRKRKRDAGESKVARMVDMFNNKSLPKNVERHVLPGGSKYCSRDGKQSPTHTNMETQCDSQSDGTESNKGSDNQNQADIKSTGAENKMVEAKAKSIEAQVKSVEAKKKSKKAEGRSMKAENRSVETENKYVKAENKSLVVEDKSVSVDSQPATKQSVLDRLLVRFGDMADLAISCMLASDSRFVLELTYTGLVTNTQRNAILWLAHSPLWTALQAAEAAVAECRVCTPFGRLSVLQMSQSGSTAEGLSDIVLGKSSTSDHDVMYELGPCRWLAPWTGTDQPVSQDPDLASGGSPTADGRPPPLLQVVPSASPGFVTLWVVPESGCDHETPLQLSAVSVRRLMFNMQRVKHKLENSVTITGPSAAFQGPRDMYGGVDHVPCFHMPVWPAKEFLRRRRGNDFPPTAVRDDIISFGVHLVPTGHKGSPVELSENQLRLSFSRAEVIAAWHFSFYQRAALKSVKALKNRMKADGAVQLKSYFIKTAVLWLCQDAPADRWSSVMNAVRMILDWLEDAVITRRLPCFFWADINLLDGFSEDDLKATRTTINQMRGNMTRHLLALCRGRFNMEPLLDCPQEPLSEHELRLRLARGLVIRGVFVGLKLRPFALAWRYWSALVVPALLGLSEPGQLECVHHCELGSSAQQTMLLHAYLVAPADSVRGMRLTPRGEGLFSLDAGPLFGLLTDYDMDLLLGMYEPVRDWWQQQQSRPLTERPAGLTADLATPRGRTELLMNAELLRRACSESFPKYKKGTEILEKMNAIKWRYNNQVLPSLQQCKNWLQALAEADMEEKLRRSSDIDDEQATTLAELWREETYRYQSGTKLNTDYCDIRARFQDRWQLRQYAFMNS